MKKNTDPEAGLYVSADGTQLVLLHYPHNVILSNGVPVALPGPGSVFSIFPRYSGKTITVGAFEKDYPLRVTHLEVDPEADKAVVCREGRLYTNGQVVLLVVGKYGGLVSAYYVYPTLKKAHNVVSSRQVLDSYPWELDASCLEVE